MILRKISLTAIVVVLFSTAFDAYGKTNDETVDLGLQSGTLWATCNVGAKNPWDNGNYYAWGETKTKKEYNWNTYKYCDGWYIKNLVAYSNTFTKYCNDSTYGKNGFTDTLTILEPADDVASTALGADFSMPTSADWKELAEQCHWEWVTTYNGQDVSGYVVYKAKSDSDKGTKSYTGYNPPVPYTLSDTHIFLPAAGCCSGLNVGISLKINCNYWAASNSKRSPDYADYFHSNHYLIFPTDVECRYFGFPVRPIRRK